MGGLRAGVKIGKGSNCSDATDTSTSSLTMSRVIHIMSSVAIISRLKPDGVLTFLPTNASKKDFSESLL